MCECVEASSFRSGFVVRGLEYGRGLWGVGWRGVRGGTCLCLLLAKGRGKTRTTYPCFLSLLCAMLPMEMGVRRVNTESNAGELCVCVCTQRGSGAQWAASRQVTAPRRDG